ncbi:YbaB/EbfC family nucleoid-associated protein [Micromonospora sp. NPDC049751]|uniref:YbaB/EbfC family nucleoid-associated protein n=1 Tax=Micromonospora sp. NPDC049751 TaxID=3154837 RepID=UPI0033D4673E
MAPEPSFAAAGVDDLLTKTQQALSAMRSGQPEEEGSAELLRAVGAAGDGLVVATVVQSGRLESMAIDPRLLRHGTETVSEHIMTAVNAALDGLKAQINIAAPADVNALAARLSGLQEQSVRQMAMFGEAMQAVVARLDVER